MLTILAPRLGKISAIAKRVRRITSKFCGHVELFGVADFVLAEGRTWYVVTGVETIRSFKSSSLTMTEQAGYAAKLIDRVIQEGDEASGQVFDLFDRTLTSLCVTPSSLVLRQFEWQLLLAIGSQPELSRCSHCASALVQEQLGLCPRRGGALCPTCITAESVHVPISAETLKVLRLFERAPVILADRLQVSASITEELARVSRAFLETTLESSIRQPVYVSVLSSVG